MGGRVSTVPFPEDPDAVRTGEESWPVALNGVTESLVATRGENDRWNVAALGLHAEWPVRARTWGRTRTRRNFERFVETELHGQDALVVQFTTDPVAFVRAALDRWERDEPILESADAWVSVGVERVTAGREDETEWVDWHLRPGPWAVREQRVPTVNRGFAAVVEATVAASRLDVPSYDESTQRQRIETYSDVATRCGGDREQLAIEMLENLIAE
jgi:hypothetical protein